MTPAFVVRESRDKTALAQFFNTNPPLYAYLLGDLDPFFFDNSRWWIARRGDVSENIIDASLLSYNAFSTPVLIGLADNDAQASLWRHTLKTPPAQAHVHFRKCHTEILAAVGELERFGTYYKMLWRRDKQHPDTAELDMGEVATLAPEDIQSVRDLHQSASPGAYFDERLLKTGLCFGIWRAGAADTADILAAFAGCHVYSQQYSVAALGAIATHPDYRRQGFGARVTTRLLDALGDHINCITLNVHSKNTPALKIYERLGFVVECEYEEALLSTD